MSLLLDLRKSGLGGTDASAVLGLNPWRTPLQVWCEKRGLAPEQPQTIAMRRGIALEQLAADLYAEETGRTLWKPENVYHHPEHDFLLCSPDRLVTDEQRGVECKSVLQDFRDGWGAPGTDEVPDHVLVQCLHSLACFHGYSAWDVSALVGDTHRIYTVPRSGLVDEMVKDLRAWWQRYMIEGEEPAAVAADNDFLARRWPVDLTPMKSADADAYSLATDFKMARAAEKEAAEQKEAAAAALKAMIGDGMGIEGEGWKVTWRAARPTPKTNWEAVARELLGVFGRISKDAAKLIEPQFLSTVHEHTIEVPGSRRFLYSEGKNA